MPSEDLIIEKHIEAEMSRCLSQPCTSLTKENGEERLTKDSVS